MSAIIRAFRMHAAPALGVTALRLHTVEIQFTGETAPEPGRARPGYQIG